jgi:hypothetical protein
MLSRLNEKPLSFQIVTRSLTARRRAAKTHPTPARTESPSFWAVVRRIASKGKKGERLMDVKVKLSLAFRVSESALEDAMAEYDEVMVEGLIKEILDKAIACEDIQAKVEEGPNTLEEYDQLSKG